ncbi:hypothetical protein [Pseudomonas fluorescens]|uniref:Uncharacterized protein n=1 Tax=Pseudomonas fluorescens TaxID=294 RepID=A0A5E7BJY2_PSEFL|nr:hypothetical protein [Pseudomonas fluorescens]VVN89787.1 hypothetical protein PS691_01772 [Pseudomonas fluorescens]
MKPILTLCAWALMLLLTSAHVAAKSVQNYRSVFIPVYKQQEDTLYLAIRAFEDGKQNTSFLIVNSETLETYIVESTGLKFRKPNDQDNGYISNAEIQSTPYARALKSYTSPPFLLDNHGLTHGEQQFDRSAFLTIDLCPSVK